MAIIIVCWKEKKRKNRKKKRKNNKNFGFCFIFLFFYYKKKLDEKLLVFFFVTKQVRSRGKNFYPIWLGDKPRDAYEDPINVVRTGQLQG